MQQVVDLQRDKAFQNLGIQLLAISPDPVDRVAPRLRSARAWRGDVRRTEGGHLAGAAGLGRTKRRALGFLAAASLFGALAHALNIAFGMTWEILWALVLGFALSAAVQAVVSKSEMTRLLPDDSARTITIACGLGAASSSCSYAAVALARSIFRKGANFTAAMAFEFASTNLVIELGIILALLMGWQFTLAEFV